MRPARAALAGLALLGATSARAVDSYLISIATNVMRGDIISFTLTPFDSGLVDNTPHNVSFPSLPAGVTVSPNNVGSGVPIAGPTGFTMSVGAAAASGVFSLVAENRPFTGVSGSAFVNIEETVDHFDINPPSPVFTGAAGVGFLVEIIARDAFGAVVDGYHDNVTVAASTGDVIVDGVGVVINGASFINGRATATVAMFGTDPTSGTNRLTVTATRNYPGQPVGFLASGSRLVGIDPGPYDHITLLFPGESLAPGQLLSGGKTGVALPATANVPINNVFLYLVDAFHNPIDTNPGGVNISYRSVSHPLPPNADTVPGVRAMPGIFDLMNGLFTFQISGVGHTVEAQDLGTGETSQSTIFVNSGAANTIVFSSPIASPRTATDLLVMGARITDGTPAANTVISYNGPVTVTVNDCLGLGIPANPNFLDTDLSLPGIQATVQFVNGVWPAPGFTVPIQVFKAFTNACLRFADTLGNTGITNNFENQPGPESRLHIELPGQTFTSGAAPGNNPLQPPNPQLAGNVVTVRVFVIDDAWNQVTTSAGDTVSIDAVNGFVDLTNALPLMPGSGGPASVTGVRLRTAFPANAQQLIATKGSLSGTSDLFTVNPRPYNQVILAPQGETLRPGINPATTGETDGKTGLISTQAVNVNFPVSVYLTDDFFNPILNPPLAGGIWPTITWALTTPVGGSVIFPAPNPFPMTGSTLNTQLNLGNLGANVVRVTDNSPAPKNISETIDVQAGPVSRFVVTPNAASVTADPIAPQTAGAAFPMSFKAFDSFNNIARNFGGVVRLELWENGVAVPYAGTISPSTLTFVANPVTGGEILNQPITIFYAGPSLGLAADQLQIRAFITTPTVVQGLSAFFNVQELGGWANVVTTLPGETRRPGLGPTVLKSGTPTPVLAGNSLPVTVTAVDLYGNRIDQAAVADLSVLTPGVFSNLGAPPQVTLSNGLGIGFVQVFTAGNTALNANVASMGFASSSTVSITRGSYSASTGRLLLLAPGETVLPGSPSAPGKNTVTISSVQANTSMTYTLLATDRFYNVDTTFTGNTIGLTSNDGAISLANIPITNGTGTVSNVFLRGNLPNPSLVRVTATDAADTAKTSFSDVPVTPGAFYEITVPATAVVGSTWPMTVVLRDPVTLLPLPVNNSITLTAVTSTGAATVIPIGVALATLNNGSVTFDQHYDYVETIKIRVTDGFSRIAESSNIDITPNGLKYRVSLPATSRTTDDIFPVTVGLYDTIFDLIPIRGSAYQHTFNVGVEAGGLPAVGSYPVTTATLTEGLSTFNFSYTKAEHIVVRATGSVGITPVASGIDDMDITPGAYVKVQALAPGEVAVPGVPSLTGKSSAPVTPQAARESFSMTVNAVDRFWNVVSNLNTPLTPTIQLSASDGSLSALPQQGFSNGQSLFSGISLNSPPQVTLTARDTGNPAIFNQAVIIPLTGRVYIASATPSNPGLGFRTGSANPIDVDLRLFRISGASTGTLVAGFTGEVTVEPLTWDLQALSTGNVVVTVPSPVSPSRQNVFTMNPSGVINLQIVYRVAEDIVLRFRDSDGWTGLSAPISLLPTGVTFEISVPTQTVVGPPTTFPMTITPRDVATLTIPKNIEVSTVTISAFSVSGTTTPGPLLVTTANLDGGAVTFPQGQTVAGTFRFRVTDGSLIFDSNPIVFLPGPLAGLMTDLPATLEAGTTQQVRVTLVDAFSNPIPNLVATFGLSNPSFATLSTTRAVTDVNGQALTDMQTSAQRSGLVDFVATSGGFSVRQAFRLLGPPTTTLSVSGLGSVVGQGLALKPGDQILLNATVQPGQTLTSINFRIDGAGGFSVYNSLAPITFASPGVHTIEYFGIAQSALTHTETTRVSRTVFVSAITTPAEGLVNFPNPFRAGRDVTFLEYYLSGDSGVRLTIYDLMGGKVHEREVAQGQPGGQNGFNQLSWDGRNDSGEVVGNGGYVAILELKNEGRMMRRKIAVRK